MLFTIILNTIVRNVQNIYNYHPFIIFFYCLILSRVTVGHTLSKYIKQVAVYTFRIPNEPDCMSLDFGLYNEIWVSREKPQRHGKNMQVPYIKLSNLGLLAVSANQEATVPPLICICQVIGSYSQKYMYYMYMRTYFTFVYVLCSFRVWQRLIRKKIVEIMVNFLPLWVASNSLPRMHPASHKITQINI